MAAVQFLKWLSSAARPPAEGRQIELANCQSVFINPRALSTCRNRDYFAAKCLVAAFKWESLTLRKRAFWPLATLVLSSARKRATTVLIFLPLIVFTLSPMLTYVNTTTSVFCITLLMIL